MRPPKALATLLHSSQHLVQDLQRLPQWPIEMKMLQIPQMAAGIL